MSEDPRRSEAKRLHLEKGWTQAAIATHLGVSTRTVERWAKADGWTGQKKAHKVVPIKAVSSAPTVPIDEKRIVDNAIRSLDNLLASSDTDTRGIGGIAGALVKLLEYRRKIEPPTAAEVVEQAIAIGIPPQEFVAELKKQWQLRA